MSRLKRLRPGDVGMSVITYLELVYGACKSTRVRENLARIELLERLIPALAIDSRVAGHPSRTGPSDLAYKALKVAAIGLRAARTAGGTPPTIPISSAKPMPPNSRSGVTRNANDTCDQVWKFSEPVV